MQLDFVISITSALGTLVMDNYSVRYDALALHTSSYYLRKFRGCRRWVELLYCGYDCMVTLGPGGRSVASEGVDHLEITWCSLMFKECLDRIVPGVTIRGRIEGSA